MSDVTYLTDDDGLPLVVYKLEPREGVEMPQHRRLSDYMATEGIGGTTIEEDGTIAQSEGATVWDDITGSLVGRRLSSTTGKVDFDWSENTVVFQSGGSISNSADIVNFNIQVPHATKEDSTLDLHIHWIQDTATARELTVKHRVQDNGATTATAWTTTVVSTDADAKFTYTSGSLNQISDLVDIDLTGIGISAVIQFQIARTDSESGDMHATFIDAHTEKNSLGSRSEYSK